MHLKSPAEIGRNEPISRNPDGQVTLTVRQISRLEQLGIWSGQQIAAVM